MQNLSVLKKEDAESLEEQGKGKNREAIESSKDPLSVSQESRPQLKVVLSGEGEKEEGRWTASGWSCGPCGFGC